MKNSVSFKDLYQVIDDFRKENNLRFDKIEAIFNKHCEEQIRLTDKYISNYKTDIDFMDKRIKPLEKIADRALFGILFVSGIIAAGWQIVVGWLKKELKI